MMNETQTKGDKMGYGIWINRPGGEHLCGYLIGGDSRCGNLCVSKDHYRALRFETIEEANTRIKSGGWENSTSVKSHVTAYVCEILGCPDFQPKEKVAS